MRPIIEKLLLIEIAIVSVLFAIVGVQSIIIIIKEII